MLQSVPEPVDNFRVQIGGLYSRSFSGSKVMRFHAQATLHGLVKVVTDLQLRDKEVTRELQYLKETVRQFTEGRLKEPSTQVRTHLVMTNIL